MIVCLGIVRNIRQIFVPSIFAAAIDGAVQAAAGEANADFVAGLDGIAAREGFAFGVVGQRVAALQDVERAQVVQVLHQCAQPRLFALPAAVGGGMQAFAELVGALLCGADLPLRVLLVQAVCEGLLVLLRVLQTATGCAMQLLLEAGEVLKAAAEVGATVCGGGCRRRCAQVGGKVGQRHVGFVANTADDGDGARGNGADEVGVVVRPQVFEAAAAADEQQRVAFAAAVGSLDLPDELRRCLFALDERGVDDDADQRVAAAQGGEGIVDGGAARAGDDADLSRRGRDGALARGIETTFGGEHVAAAFEFGFERADARRFNLVEDELVVAARLIEGGAAMHAHREAVGQFARRQAEAVAVALEQRAGDLRRIILEGEVKMAGGGAAQIADFAFDPDIAVITFKLGADAGV